MVKENGIFGDFPCEKQVDSVFIGGGTPSLLAERDVAVLLEGISKTFTLPNNAEITIEANPNSLSIGKLKSYLTNGINRISIGQQSFDDEILSILGRIHTAKEGIAAARLADSAGFANINLDLMFGIPGQTLNQWLKSLEQAIQLEPTHLSLYSLQIEEGTPLYNDYRLERLDPVNLQTDRMCFHYGIDYLSQKGFSQYEISNYAKTGFQCKHNLKYWNMDEFLGLGAGSSSYVGGRRWKNVSSVEQWHERIERDESPIDACSVEIETPRSAMSVFMITGLRKSEGISLVEFEKRYQMTIFDAFQDSMAELEKFRQMGLVDWETRQLGKLWLTEKGIDVSNNILECFV